MRNLKILGTVLCILLVCAFTIIAANKIVTAGDDKDKEAIKTVIKNALELPDSAYTESVRNLKAKTLDKEKDTLKQKYLSQMQEFFNDDLTKRLSKAWVDRQFEGTDNQIEQIDNGVVSVNITGFSIENDTATVSAQVDKFLTDRVLKNGVYYHDKMEGNDGVKVTLLKINNKWKLSSLEIEPDMGSTTHVVTKE